MQKRNRNRNRNRTRTRNIKSGGGLFDSISSGWNSLSQGASNLWDKTKRGAENAYASATTSTSASNTYSPSSYTTPSTYTSPSTNVTPTYTTGGRKRSRKMRGGYHPNSSTTNIAFTAAPISGIKTAQPHNWVGGKTRRHRKGKHSRSYRHHRKH
jgi:hypothetical protein